MSHLVSDPNTANLVAAALGGNYHARIGPNAHLIVHSLPASLVAAVTFLRGVLWIVVDIDKPRAMAQAREMLRQYWGDMAIPEPVERRIVEFEMCPLRDP